MGQMVKVRPMEVEEGPDAINRAATIARVVARAAVRREGGGPGIGVITSRYPSGIAHTATTIAQALGFEAHVIDDTLALQGDPSGRPVFHAVAIEGSDGARRAAGKVAGIVAATSPGARTAILVCLQGDLEDALLAVARTLRMDPDDIEALVL